MSYADAWNQTWKGPRATGPTTIIVDGVHEEHEEHIMNMDTDEDDYTLEFSVAVDDIRAGRETAKLNEYHTSDLMSAMEIDWELVCSFLHIEPIGCILNFRLHFCRH